MEGGLRRGVGGEGLSGELGSLVSNEPWWYWQGTHWGCRDKG